MQLKCGLVVSSVFIFFSAFPVYSHDIDPVFQELKSSGEKYEVTGTVCEQVARLELEQSYPKDQYAVLNSITYTQYGQTLGELDVVVFRKRDSKAVLLGEVKCWKDLSAAHHKAVTQRDRFRYYLNEGGRGIDFYQTSDRRIHYSPKQFEGTPPFIFISQEEGERSGFDLALSYTLEELMRLRSLLMSCQDRGECLRPQH